MTVRLRDATAADAAVVLGWFGSHAEATLWGGGDVPLSLAPAWLAREIEAAPEAYRVVEEGRSLVGIYGLRAAPHAKRLHLIRIAVAPSHRGQGIARRIVDDALAAAKVDGVETLSLNVYGSNVHAIGVYEHLGFRRVRTKPAPEDASGVAIYMERSV